jgi:hypothetical protein
MPLKFVTALCLFVGLDGRAANHLLHIKIARRRVENATAK